MTPLKYTRIKNKKQYFNYCSIHENLVFTDEDKYEDEIELLDLLIERKLGAHILLETCIGDILRDEDILSRYREAGIMFIYAGVEATSQERLDLPMLSN